MHVLRYFCRRVHAHSGLRLPDSPALGPMLAECILALPELQGIAVVRQVEVEEGARGRSLRVKAKPSTLGSEFDKIQGAAWSLRGSFFCV